jgi:hypothetical protein
MVSRMSIWQDKVSWPDDTTDYIFLGRAVDAVGRSIFGNDWTGREAVIIHYKERPPRLLPVGNSRTQLRKFPESSTPLTPEVAEAVKQTIDRLDVVQKGIRLACSNSEIRSATRTGDGDLRAISPSAWRREDLKHRFATCKMDPRQPFNAYAVSTEWIFIHQADATADFIGGQFHLVSLGSHPIRGYDKEIPIYDLMRDKARDTITNPIANASR